MAREGCRQWQVSKGANVRILRIMVVQLTRRCQSLLPTRSRWQPTRSFKRTPAQAQASTARPRRAGAFISFLPRASQLCPSPKAHARASLRRNRPRAGALLRAHTLWLQRRRGAGRARGASVPRSAQRAARGASTAGGELALTRRRTRGVRRGARRRQAAATGAVRAALLNAAVARPSCRAIGRGAAC